MNLYEVTDKKINNGKPFELASALTLDMFNTQIAEVLIDEDYEDGCFKKNMTIIDCGANMGLTALYFKEYADIIYALEPSSRHYESLVYNTKQYPNIKPFNLAITAVTGQDTLVANEGDPAPESFFATGSLKEIVQTMTLADFFAQEKIEHVDLLKIDTEGAEYVIFPSNGFRKVADKIDVIIGEAHYANDLHPEFVPEILKEYGFSVTWLTKKNMFKAITLTEADRKDTHSYKIWLQTLFLAKRI